MRRAARVGGKTACTYVRAPDFVEYIPLSLRHVACTWLLYVCVYCMLLASDFVDNKPLVYTMQRPASSRLRVNVPAHIADFGGILDWGLTAGMRMLCSRLAVYARVGTCRERSWLMRVGWMLCYGPRAKLLGVWRGVH